MYANSVTHSSESAPKKVYAAPHLQIYGSLEKITQAGTVTGVSGDNGNGKNNGKTGG